MSSTEPLDESADGSTTPDDGVDAPDTPTSIDEPDPPDGSPEPADRESAPEVEATGEPEAEPAVEDAVSAVATGSGEPADPEAVTSDDVAPPDPAPESTEEAEASTGESAESESGEGEPAESEDAGEDVSEAPASPSTEPDDAAATTPLPAQPAPAPGPVDDGSDSERYNWPSPPDTEKRRILPWLDWKFSILLPLALLLVLATALWQLTTQPDLIEFTIQNGSTGETIAGAELIVGNDVYLADDQGVVTIERPDAPTAVQVSADGFIAMTGEVDDNTAKEQTVPLRPASLVGQLVDEATGEPIAGANIAVLDPAGNVVSATRTDDAGRYRLADVPDGAMVQIEAARYGSLTQPVGTEIEMSFSLTLQSVSGVVLSAAGEPVQGAVVRAGDATAVSGGDGIFALEGVTDGAEVSVTAPGYEATTGIVQDGRVPDVQLTALMVKGVYANLGLLGTPGGLEQLVEIANTTEINAIVIDIKQDTIYYDSQVQFFLDAGTVRPIYDAGEVLQLLEDNGIYAIARLVVFQDPLVAEARPELAVHDVNGDLWRNEMNVAWVSAFNEELWDANIALAVEAIGLGFDEVQYDYVRFPSDGDLTTADFGREYTAEARETAITEFVKRSHEAINDAGGLLSADLFGFVTLMDDEQYIGQRFSALEPHLDYISMMIYPSHFETGNIASAPGHPNDYPYETILESLQRSESNVPGSGEKFRPWLQDFSYGFNGLRDYTADDVRAQIDAAEDFGASGWLLWGDPFNVTVEALKPESAS